MQLIQKEIEQQLMKLPAIERACLAEKLLSSLENDAQSNIDKAWAQEAENRVKAFEKGELIASEDSAVYRRLEEKHDA